MLGTTGYPPDVDRVGAPVIGVDFLDNACKTVGCEDENAVGSATGGRVGFLDNKKRRNQLTRLAYKEGP